MKRNAFTLIELLAVIAILLLLASLLLPALSSMYERGRQAQCLANLRTQGTATLVYASDHEGFITRWRSVDEIEAAGVPYGGWNYYGWFQWSVNPYHSIMLSYYRIDNEFWCGPAGLFNQRYVRDARPFYCPGDPVRHVETNTNSVHHSAHDFYRNSGGDPKIWQSYSFNAAQAFRIGENKTTRVGGGYSTRIYPFPFRPHNAILVMDPVSPSASLTYHGSVWQTFNYDGSGSRRSSPELASRMALAPANYNSWPEFETEVLPLLAE